MRHFPIFLDLRDRRVVVSGAGAIAIAKLRLLLKTEARIAVFGAEPAPEVRAWAARGPARAGRAAGRARATPRARRCSTRANGDAAEDARAAAIGRAEGALVNIVDDLVAATSSRPAIVDRDPVTVAIGTEGAAPVLARADQGRDRGDAAADARAAHPHRPGVPRPGRGARRQGAAAVLVALLLRDRAAGAGRRARRRREAELERLLAEGVEAPRGLRAPRRRRPGRPGAPDAEGAPAAARGRRGDPRPAGAGGDPGARAARGDDRRGRQDRAYGAVLEAGRHQRADGRARRAPARPWCG